MGDTIVQSNMSDRTKARRVAVLEQLKCDIEDLVDGEVLYSRTARTPRNSVHVSIANGAIKRECEPALPPKTLLEMCADSMEVARELFRSAAIDGRAMLVWRCEPVFEDGNLYLRLCFERV